MIISDYTQMDRALREEREYLLNLCKAIKKAGCNVLLIQKSILRCVSLCWFSLISAKCSDAINEMALHFLAKMKIMVIKDVERDDVEFICKVRSWARFTFS